MCHPSPAAGLLAPTPACRQVQTGPYHACTDCPCPHPCTCLTPLRYRYTRACNTHQATASGPWWALYGSCSTRRVLSVWRSWGPAVRPGGTVMSTMREERKGFPITPCCSLLHACATVYTRSRHVRGVLNLAPLD